MYEKQRHYPRTPRQERHVDHWQAQICGHSIERPLRLPSSTVIGRLFQLGQIAI